MEHQQMPETTQQASARASVERRLLCDLHDERTLKRYRFLPREVLNRLDAEPDWNAESVIAGYKVLDSAFYASLTDRAALFVQMLDVLMDRPEEGDPTAEAWELFLILFRSLFI
jgi:hypothetical protein